MCSVLPLGAPRISKSLKPRIIRPLHSRSSTRHTIMALKSVLITGCSEGGIGHALALEWHKQGYRVFATARKLSAMADLEKAGIETLAMDVTDTTSLQSVKEQVEKRTGGTLDVLINNAGQGTHLPEQGETELC